MQINLHVSCVPETISKQSECATLLSALTHYRNVIKDDHRHYGEDGTGEVIGQIDELIVSVNDGMLFALQSLGPLQIFNENLAYKAVYVVDSTSERGGRAK